MPYMLDLTSMHFAFKNRSEALQHVHTNPRTPTIKRLQFISLNTQTHTLTHSHTYPYAHAQETIRIARRIGWLVS